MNAPIPLSISSIFLWIILSFLISAVQAQTTSGDLGHTISVVKLDSFSSMITITWKNTGRRRIMIQDDPNNGNVFGGDTLSNGDTLIDRFTRNGFKSDEKERNEFTDADGTHWIINREWYPHFAYLSHLDSYEQKFKVRTKLGTNQINFNTIYFYVGPLKRRTRGVLLKSSMPRRSICFPISLSPY